MSYPYYSKLENPYASGPAPGYAVGAPPYGAPHNVPRYPSDYRKRSSGSSCMRCMCCCCCFTIILIITITIIIMSLFNIYDPKVPEYKIEGIQVKKFALEPNSILNTEFEVDVKVDNPNKKLGFNYGADNFVEVRYMDQQICGGKFPPFHQDHENTMNMKLLLKGQTVFGQELQKQLTKSIEIRNIPIQVNVRVPVNIVVGEQVTLREFEIYVFCHLTLDNLSPDGSIGILSKDTRFKFEL